MVLELYIAEALFQKCDGMARTRVIGFVYFIPACCASRNDPSDVSCHIWVWKQMLQFAPSFYDGHAFVAQESILRSHIKPGYLTAGNLPIKI